MKWRAPTILQGHKAKEPGIRAGLKGRGQGQDPEARLFGLFGFSGSFGFIVFLRFFRFSGFFGFWEEWTD